MLTTGQTAALGAFATLVGGLSAGLAGANAQAGAQAGQNVALNNDAPHWGLPTSQTQTGLLGQRTGSGDGLTAGNPLSDAAAVACAGGTQTCDTQLFQTLSQARGANADQALGTIGSAAPYVGGALGLTLGGVLFGPEILAGCAANPVLCVNQGAILTGEIYVGFNGMPVGTGAPLSAGVSSAADNAVAASTKLVGADGSLGAAAARVQPQPGVFDIVVHGDASGFYVQRQDGSWVSLNANQVSKYMNANGYAGEPVRLISCETGACNGTAAQNLANK